MKPGDNDDAECHTAGKRKGDDCVRPQGGAMKKPRHERGESDTECQYYQHGIDREAGFFLQKKAQRHAGHGRVREGVAEKCHPSQRDKHSQEGAGRPEDAGGDERVADEFVGPNLGEVHRGRGSAGWKLRHGCTVAP